MRKLLLLFAIILVCAPAGFAQDYSSWEYFIGYAHERANNGADRLDERGRIVNANGTTQRADFVSKRINYNGVTGEVVANVHRNWGLVANFAATWAHPTYTDALTGRRFEARTARYTLLGGPRFNWRNSTRLIPFAHALFGVTRGTVDFDNNDFTCATTGESLDETAFTMAFGAGLDIRASNHIDIRAIQLDYIPTYFDHGREDAWRFSTGVKIK